MFVSWFENIEEISSKLTSGNVSHQGATIRNKAIRCSEAQSHSWGGKLVNALTAASGGIYVFVEL